MNLPYLRISIVSDCNANCLFCHNEGHIKGKRLCTSPQKGNLPIEIYQQIANYFRNIFSKVIFTGGEPLLSPDVMQIIEIFNREKYETAIITNGVLLTEPVQANLKKAGLASINISINSLNAEKYSHFYGIDCLKRVTSNIATLSMYFHPSRIRINFIIDRKTDIVSEIPEFSALSSEHNLLICPKFDLKEKDALLAKQLKKKLYALNGAPTITERIEDKRKREVCLYSNGSYWEFDDFRIKENNISLKNNPICQECLKNEQCMEGAYALRLSANGTFKPCLIRNDNTFTLQDILSPLH